jgi:predicted amidohydrolase YtcJ
MKKLVVFLSALFLFACNNKQSIDKIVSAKSIQTLDDNFSEVEAMAIHQGKIVAMGSLDSLLSRFEPSQLEQLDSFYIYPGIIDAHCHFYGLGMFMQMVDLSGSKSFDEVVARCKAFMVKKPETQILLGRGWDQTKWTNVEFPANDLLNEAFPSMPVLLKRVDGHAAIANDAALKLAGLTAQSSIGGGELLLSKGKLSGVLIDNAVYLVEQKLPKPARATQITALLEAQAECFKYGITSLTDAGLDYDVVELIDSLQSAGLLKIHLNIMLSISEANYQWLDKKGPIKKERLQVMGFKMYADGALGSRGACLTEDYHDRPHHKGLLLTSIPDMERWVKTMANNTHQFQLNTHAIGDSSNRIILNLYGKYLGNKHDRRWRIEHAQVVRPEDFVLFKTYQVVPSVQPTHATSDMYWAEQRLGLNRVKYAYAYKDLLKQLGWLPLGTDFPVEYVSPYYTFYAAVARKDANGFPANGFLAQQALSREEALRGITTWAAKSAFLEHSHGALQVGMRADFVCLSKNLLTDSLSDIRNLQANRIFILGDEVK